MLRVALLAALALGALDAAVADRVIEQPETSFELGLNSTTMPTGTAGFVAFKTCERCSMLTRSVTSSTRYFVNDRELPFADFLTAVADIRKTQDPEREAFVGLYVDVETDRVNRVVVRQPR